MSDNIIVQEWGNVRGFKFPFRMHTDLKPGEKLNSAYGPLYQLANFAMRWAGSGSYSSFVDEERGIGAFSCSLQDFRGCGRSTVTSLLYSARRDENLLKARLIADENFEGTPYHYDSIHYSVKKLDGDIAEGGIYRSGLPKGIKLRDFRVRL